MEKALLVRFEQNRDSSFYLCRHCHTHLALHHEMLHKYEENHHALFKTMNNVRLGENYEIVTGQTGAPAYCINCGSELGSKFVALKLETSAIKSGRFMIDLQVEARPLEGKPDAVCRLREGNSECMNE